MPAARLYVPRKTPAVLQRPGWGLGLVTTSTRNIVVPYISIRSPGWSTPTLAASAQASIVPAATGVPAGIPVDWAAASETVPATSDGHSKRGSSRPGATWSAHSSIQRFFCRS